MKDFIVRWRKYLNEKLSDKDSDQVSKVVFVNSDNKILMLKSAMGNFKGEWDLPGGHIHHGETNLQGLKREVKEETDLEVSKAIFKIKINNITFYRAELPEGKISLSKEHSEYDFFPLEEINKKDFKTSTKFKEAIQQIVK